MNERLRELKKLVDKYAESTKRTAEVIAVHDTKTRDELLELARTAGSKDDTLFGCRLVINGGMVPGDETWVGSAAMLDPFAPPPAEGPFQYHDAISAGSLPKADA